MDYQVGDTVYDEEGNEGIIVDIQYKRDREIYLVDWEDAGNEWMERSDIYPN